ncbi:hypothetical protein ALC57_04833 [Trachymyrmex cornetzi]|uniref:Uncharacterized protein n=1 Tax=Trachymyrmex cornetzi TaxID=471704 RepID=A0A195EDX9_9HYME|nr:hypothetical protein ALC57_04833 [Trachymyrmex cornetzi]
MPHWSWPRSLVRGNVTRRQGNCLVDSRRTKEERERERERAGDRRREQGEQGPHGTRLGVGTPKSCGRDLRMREGRLWWSIGRRAPQQRRVTAPLFWESGTCFFPLHRRRASHRFNCIFRLLPSSSSAASQAR